MIFDDIDYAFRDYDPVGAYGQSKTANVLFAVEATRRWARDGILANALMPGGIATPLQRHLPAEYAEQALTAFGAAGTDFKTVEQGAATSTLLAASPVVGGYRRPLLRGLQRSQGHRPPGRAEAGRRRTVRAGSGERRTALGAFAGAHRLPADDS